MKRVEPRVYLVAETRLIRGGENEPDVDCLEDYLEDLGVTEEEWFADPRVSDAENLLEAAGRMCYRSWMPWDPKRPEASNPNVAKVREGNATYLKNVIRSEHGALLEHASVSMIFRDVSRVFTHELVRHRAGWGYSQESLRYVRLDGDIRFWLPKVVTETTGAAELFEQTVDYLAGVQARLHKLFKIDEESNFARKKALTSMFRRLAPIGLATSIMATGNLRAWRHTINLRTAEAAEEEIRLVFGRIARILKGRYPNAFFDMQENAAGEWVFEHPKV